MSDEFDNTIRDAFQNDPPAEVGRINELRQQMMDEYRRRLRKAERYSWAYVLLSTWALVYGLGHFMITPSIKMGLGFALLVMVMIQMQILVKLWYWVVNTKIGVLRELKLMQLSLAAGKPALIPEQVSDLRWRAPGCTRRERILWLLIIVVGSLIVSMSATAKLSIANHVVFWPPPGTMHARVSVGSDGAVETSRAELLTWDNPCQDWYPSEAPVGEDCRWYDRQGQPLYREVTVRDGRAYYRVYPNEHVGIGEPVWIRQVSTCQLPRPDAQGIWTCEFQHTWGGREMRYVETLQLPPGAEVVSMSLEPMSRASIDGRPTLEFHAFRPSMQPFKSVVRYRLPAATSLPSGSR